MFYQVVSQEFGDHFAHAPALEQALSYTVRLLGKREMYKFALELDGPGAGTPMGFVYERGKDGIYTLRRNEFSRL